MFNANLNIAVIIGVVIITLSSATSFAEAKTPTKTNQYKVVDTGQVEFFDNYRAISQPSEGQPFSGQDAQYVRNTPSYTDNGDGTITDNVTGLMWQKGYEVLTYKEATKQAKTLNLAKHRDWRVPTIKEAYSLILFSGVDVSSEDMTRLPERAVPFIDTDFFDFEYGSNGERVIDVQILSSTVYRGKTMGGQATVFGVNVADGRIKGYPITDPRTHLGKKFTVRFVRGNPDYGKNDFKDNKDGTISDLATGLMWEKSDSEKAMSWEDALSFAQQRNEENYLGHSDWRLPNAKELQSIVDYSRSPQKTRTAAIDRLFEVSQIKDERGKKNYPFYWSSTTHKNISDGHWAVYVCFGEALGYYTPPSSHGRAKLQDVHGAGAQRSDPKTGNPDDYPQGHGPQGDVVRILNYVRLVRDI